MDWTRTLFFVLAAIAPAATPPAFAGPANDDFADARMLEGLSGSARGTNEGSTREPGEPKIEGNDGGRSVWWRWVAPLTEAVTFDTFGSGFDTILGVYTGAAVDSLQLVAENDDAGSGIHSVVTFQAVAGKAYLLAVDGLYAGGEDEEVEEDDVDEGYGRIVLNWISGEPVNDDFARGVMLEGPSGRAGGLNHGASREPQEPVIESEPGGGSVWWRWVAPRTEKVTVHTFGSSFDTLLGVYTGAAVEALALVAENDDTIVGPGRCGRPPCRRPPPPETRPESRVDFEATAGSLYHFVVDGFEGEQGSVLLTWLSAPDSPPENDLFAGRVWIDGHEGFVLGSNAGATTEEGEPDHAAGGGTKSVWWSWLAPGDGTAEISTFGSTFDTVVAVYTGAAVDSLDLVAENDDNERMDEETSLLRFSVRGGAEFQIAVDGYEAKSGIVALGWSFIPGEAPPRFVRGDCDGDGSVNISDAVCSLNWLFLGGEEPGCVAATNVDGVDGVNITDPIVLLVHLALGGFAPVEPFPRCGPGTLAADEEVGCETPPRSCG